MLQQSLVRETFAREFAKEIKNTVPQSIFFYHEKGKALRKLEKFKPIFFAMREKAIEEFNETAPLADKITKDDLGYLAKLNFEDFVEKLYKLSFEVMQPPTNRKNYFSFCLFLSAFDLHHIIETPIKANKEDLKEFFGWAMNTRRHLISQLRKCLFGELDIVKKCVEASLRGGAVRRENLQKPLFNESKGFNENDKAFNESEINSTFKNTDNTASNNTVSNSVNNSVSDNGAVSDNKTLAETSNATSAVSDAVLADSALAGDVLADSVLADNSALTDSKKTDVNNGDVLNNNQVDNNASAEVSVSGIASSSVSNADADVKAEKSEVKSGAKTKTGKGKAATNNKLSDNKPKEQKVKSVNVVKKEERVEQAKTLDAEQAKTAVQAKTVQAKTKPSQKTARETTETVKRTIEHFKELEGKEEGNTNDTTAGIDISAVKKDASKLVNKDNEGVSKLSKNASKPASVSKTAEKAAEKVVGKKAEGDVKAQSNTNVKKQEQDVIKRMGLIKIVDVEEKPKRVEVKREKNKERKVFDKRVVTLYKWFNAQIKNDELTEENKETLKALGLTGFQIHHYFKRWLEERNGLDLSAFN